MKKLLLLALAVCLPFSMALAQTPPDPANFHVWFGTIDGSALSVGTDKDIQVPVWASTDPTPGNGDTITFMHVPLMSKDQYITARNGGFFPAFGVGLWDDKSFLTPNGPDTVWTPPHNLPLLIVGDPAISAGFMSQSLLGFAYLTDPQDSVNWLYTMGAKQLIGTFRMHTTADNYVPQTVDAFSQGHNPANAGLLWGVVGGSRSVIPTQHYAQLYFSPNNPPVIDTPADGAYDTTSCAMIIHLVGHDDDPAQTLTFTASEGVITNQVQVGVNITATLTIKGSTGMHDVVITLSDGTDTDVATVHVYLTNIPGEHDATLWIDTVYAAPGTNSVRVCVHLTSPCPVGGFNILLNWDPTVLTLVDAFPGAAIQYGWEYWNWVHDPCGVGTSRFIWIWDTPENNPNRPPVCWQGGDTTLFCLDFNVGGGLPFSADVPICFYSCPDSVPDYESNSISDCSGNYFTHPLKICGAIKIADPLSFKGDPNMNCFDYEIGDAVLVAQRLIIGYTVWAGDNLMPNSATQPPVDPDSIPHQVPGCNRHHVGNDALQEAAADLNGNGRADIADLVRFINIINGYIFPKTDRPAGNSSIFMKDGAVRINSDIEVGGVLVRIAHSGEIGTPVAANGMEILSNDANGVLSVVVYSTTAKRIAAGNQTLFTLTGVGAITEASASDAQGNLMESRIGTPLPTAFAVDQNYPNPFNGKTLIRFNLPSESDVNINIYSITGQLVETLKAHFAAGVQSMIWDANNVASGVYFAKVSAGSESRTLRMTLLK